MDHREAELACIVSYSNLSNLERETLKTNFEEMRNAERDVLFMMAEHVKNHYELIDQLKYFENKRNEILKILKAQVVRRVVQSHVQLEFYRTKITEVSEAILDKARGRSEQVTQTTGSQLQPFEIHELKMIAWFSKYMSKDCFLEGVKD
jgi:hypothetical protein